MQHCTRSYRLSLGHICIFKWAQLVLRFSHHCCYLPPLPKSAEILCSFIACYMPQVPLPYDYTWVSIWDYNFWGYWVSESVPQMWEAHLLCTEPQSSFPGMTSSKFHLCHDFPELWWQLDMLSFREIACGCLNTVFSLYLFELSNEHIHVTFPGLI